MGWERANDERGHYLNMDVVGVALWFLADVDVRPPLLHAASATSH
jgi:hypothetical protein